MRTKNKWITVVGAAALVAGAVQLNPQEVTAADHGDAPLTEGDPAVDIGDFYAWQTDAGNIVAIITFAGNRDPADGPLYDEDVLYTINIDNSADPTANPAFNDNEADIQIHARFGTNTAGDWGVQLIDVPGSTDAVFDGPVDTDITNGDAMAIAGLFDDPFFFDLVGFFATRDATIDDADPADVMFASIVDGAPVDALAGNNAMAIVVEFPADAAANGNTFLQLWATTGVL